MNLLKYLQSLSEGKEKRAGPQGPEEFRVNKWITYLNLTLKNVYTSVA